MNPVRHQETIISSMNIDVIADFLAQVDKRRVGGGLTG